MRTADATKFGRYARGRPRAMRRSCQLSSLDGERPWLEGLIRLLLKVISPKTNTSSARISTRSVNSFQLFAQRYARPAPRGKERYRAPGGADASRRTR